MEEEIRPLSLGAKFVFLSKVDLKSLVVNCESVMQSVTVNRGRTRVI